MKSCRLTFSVYFLMFITCTLTLDSSGLSALAFFCAAVHELGHFLALNAYHVRVKRIDCRLFGVDIVTDHTKCLSYKQEMIIAMAGILANFFLCLGSWVCWKCDIWTFPAEAIFSMSLFLGIFNLLPVRNLDGGHALGALLCAHTSYQKSSYILTAISCFILVPLSVFGIYLLICSRNTTLFAASIYLMVSLTGLPGMLKRKPKTINYLKKTI